MSSVCSPCYVFNAFVQYSEFRTDILKSKHVLDSKFIELKSTNSHHLVNMK